MASSDNLASMEPWTFRPTLTESWISEAFARDTETLTRALQKSLSDHHHSAAADGGAAAAAIASFFGPPLEAPTMTVKTQFNGGGSGSDPDTPASGKGPRGSIPVNGGGKAATKRKSRASKRTTTTFITADPANFRQMVQQVTGVRFPGGSGNPQVPAAPVLLKPEPQRPSVNRVVQGQGCLPTLDTSAFLLDHHQIHRQQALPPSAAAASEAQPPLAAVPTLEYPVFDSFSSFPTLESCSF